VDVVMELTLDNRLKVRLHVLSSDFYNIGDGILTSQFHFVYVRTYNGDLVIFNLCSVYSLYQLSTVYTRTIKFNLHIAAADDLTFKCRSESNRNIDICN